MHLRDLLCVIEASDSPSKLALHQSLALGRAYKAEISVLAAGPKSVPPYSVFGADMVGEIFMTENEKVRQRAETMAAEAKSLLSGAGVQGNVEVCLDAFQDALVRVRQLALCRDLVVMDRPGGTAERGQILFEEVLFAAGRPILLPSGAAVEKFAKIAFAWDGSSHAARALSQALRLFGGIKEAEVLVIEGEKDLTGIAPAKNIAAHIERYGVAVRVVDLKMDADGVGSTIDKHAVKTGADLIVMGAFGRSRLREFVLGGVTRKLTRSSSKPLLLAH